MGHVCKPEAGIYFTSAGGHWSWRGRYSAFHGELAVLNIICLSNPFEFEGGKLNLMRDIGITKAENLVRLYQDAGLLGTDGEPPPWLTTKKLYAFWYPLDCQIANWGRAQGFDGIVLFSPYDKKLQTLIKL